MKVYVDGKDKIVETTADSRGRITLGSQYANEQVTVAIVSEAEDD